ncbi:predicted protein [Histoplasma mississippiense (nom. inval.)]|uniref:predicted protein n=1 Tax=Ajellomyces capsulatus (strain NAm1 / WU24) TaxID=2059318 RepID=UPI000157BBA0|nr:predicted protein [Histoplasma mississippiense (nom. inval.)]EDN04225.1 predicted protein [Histoplasma mississippiense (nom. inval.)]
MIEGEVLIHTKIKVSELSTLASWGELQDREDYMDCLPSCLSKRLLTLQLSPQASMRGQQMWSARECQDVSTAVNSTQLSISTALLHSDVSQRCSGAAIITSTASINDCSDGIYINHSVNPVNTARWASTSQVSSYSEFHQ